MAATPHLRADARRNRERIVAVAMECFASEGVECQVAEIARRAEVGNATVFRHFPSKQALVVAVVEAKMRGMLDEADEADGLGDADGALRHFVGAMCRMHVADQGLKQMAASHFQGETRLVALRDELLSRLGRLVTEAKAAGVVRADVEPIDFIVLVNGVAASVLGLEEERAGLHERYLEIAFAGLRPHQDERPLPAGPPTPDELEAALQRQAELRGGECC